MNAIVTVRFRITSACDHQDLDLEQISFEDMVRQGIKDEGLFGLVDDDYEILTISEEEL